MGSLSIWHILIVAILFSPIIAVAKILKRMGFSPFWSILYIVPVLGIFSLFFLAGAKWPNMDRSDALGDH